MSQVEPVSFGIFIRSRVGAKVVLLESNGQHYLRIGMKDKTGPYHAHHGLIFQELLEDLQLPYIMREDSHGPVAQGANYTLTGTGDCYWARRPGGSNTPLESNDLQGRILEFSMKSPIYQVPLDYNQLEKLSKYFPKNAIVIRRASPHDILQGIGTKKF